MNKLVNLKESIPSENGLTLLEEFIVLELHKNTDLAVGQLIGNVYTYYGQIPLEIIQKTLINLVTPIPIIEFSVPLEKLTFTNEILYLTDIGRTFNIDESTEEITNPYPIRLLRNFKYLINNTPIYMFGFSTESLYRTLISKDSSLLEFNKLSGIAYLNEDDIKPFILTGKVSELSIMKKYEYTDYNNMLRIKNNIYQVKLPKTNNQMKKDYLYNIGIFKELTIGVVIIRDNKVQLDNLEATLNTYYENNDYDVNEFKRLFVDEFKGVDTQQSREDYRIYYMYYNGLSKEAWVTSEELDTSLYTYRLEINNDYEFIGLTENEHIKLDLLKDKKFSNYNGIFKLPRIKPNPQVEHYFINEKGEIKISNESKLWTRNKKVSSTEIEKDMYLIKWFHKVNPNNDGRILFITKKGIIKVIDLLEYKSKSRNSQYIRALNLTEDDEIVHCEYLPLEFSYIDVEINNEVSTNYLITSLVSSKVNKGKKLKYKSDITTVKVEKS